MFDFYSLHSFPSIEELQEIPDNEELEDDLLTTCMSTESLKTQIDEDSFQVNICAKDEVFHLPSSFRNYSQLVSNYWDSKNPGEDVDIKINPRYGPIEMQLVVDFFHLVQQNKPQPLPKHKYDEYFYMRSDFEYIDLPQWALEFFQSIETNKLIFGSAMLASYLDANSYVDMICIFIAKKLKEMKTTEQMRLYLGLEDKDDREIKKEHCLTDDQDFNNWINQEKEGAEVIEQDPASPIEN